jgi:DNA-directed RNA polymerase specialized sigma24 family protein
MLLLCKGEQPEGAAPMNPSTIDLTIEYQRIRDLIEKVPSFRAETARNSRHKTSEDLASQIFLQLFERGHWDKFDPTRMTLSSYTFMGVKSLIVNEKRSRDRRKEAAATGFRDVDTIMVKVYREDDEKASTEIVSNNMTAEALLEYKEFVRGFLVFLEELREDGNALPLTYAEVFKLMSHGYTRYDMRELFFPVEVYPTLNLKQIFKDLKSLIKSYQEILEARPLRSLSA